MTEKRIAAFVVSISSILIWDLLTKMGILGGKMQTALVLLSLIPFIWASFQLINEYKFENSYAKFMFTLFFIYQMAIVARGWNFNYNDIKSYIQTLYIFWPFVIPLFIFFNKKLETFGYLFKWIFFSGVFFLLVSLVYPAILMRRLTAETFITLFVPCGFLLLNASYISNRKTNISFLLIFISIISLTYLARRSALGTLVGFVLSAYYLNLISDAKSKLFRYFPLLIIIAVFVLFSAFFENSKEVLFNKMALRLSEDTRSGVFQMFFNNLKNNMVFGNGMNGTYYCPLWDAEVDGEIFSAIQYRNLIENGWLQLMLTGGILHIVLYVLVLLPAAIRGIFMSDNQFAKACGFVVLLRMVDMFFYGIPTLTLSYILVWICVGVCYKTSILKMTNDEVRCEFAKVKFL
jgi:hypothetical protein